jgi:hypothetical protein
MAGIPNTAVSPKKVWTAPELKKTSIEMITAYGGHGGSSDGFYSRS